MQVERVSYDVNWKNFGRGYSIFIPCLDPKNALKNEVLPFFKRIKMKVLTKVVIEEGVRGLRIWRM
jgi:hypothetical protein